MRPRTARADVLGALLTGALVFLFSLILIWRDPLVFWNDDYQISILPVFADIARSWSHGEWPILSPYSWVCGNLAGEYQYGTFSVFVNVAVIAIWKMFSGFAHQAAALSVVHLLALGLGGYVLARGRALSAALATMVGLIAALNGWIICWGASDWFGALGAFAWIPWAWWGCERALCSTLNVQQSSEFGVRRSAFGVRRLLPAIWPAPFVYLVATGGFPYTVLMLAVLVVWLAIKSLVETKSMRVILPMLFGVALGFGLAAPALLALFIHVHGSAREAQPATAHWQWIVPPGALPGLILPNWTVKWADFSTRFKPHTGTELACGLVAPAAVLFGLIRSPRMMFRQLRWELLLLGIVLVATMLPTAGMFRWSFRWLPLFHLVLAICAAEALRFLGENSESRRARRSLAVFVLVIAGLTALACRLFQAGGGYAFPFMAVVLSLCAVWVALEYLAATELLSRFSGLSSWLPAAITFACLLATYLCISTNCGVPRYSFTEDLIDPRPLDPGRLYLSVYPGPEVAYRTEAQPQPSGQIVRPGSTSMWAKLHFINGYSPIRPAGVATQFVAYIHGDFDLSATRKLLSADAGPDGLLARLGIDGVTVSKDIDFKPEPDGEWELVTSNEEGRVFHRRGPPLKRVRSFASSASTPANPFTPAKISDVREMRNRVEVNVEVANGSNPALIAFSRPYFDGFTASLGDRQLPVKSERGLFPVVEVPAGSHGRLMLAYRPAWLVYGGVLAVGCAVIWLTGLIFAWRSRQGQSPS